MTTNLPMAVQRVGGELQTVMADLESYTDSKHPLTRESQVALARIIERHPDLNTKERVALLVDAFSFHGIEQRAQFVRVVETYTLELTYLAMDYLHEVGGRNSQLHEESEDDESLVALRKTGVELIGEIAGLIEVLGDCDFEVEGTEGLDYFVQRLGGLDDALNADMDRIRDCLQEPNRVTDDED